MAAHQWRWVTRILEGHKLLWMHPFHYSKIEVEKFRTREIVIQSCKRLGSVKILKMQFFKVIWKFSECMLHWDNHPENSSHLWFNICWKTLHSNHLLTSRLGICSIWFLYFKLKMKLKGDDRPDATGKIHSKICRRKIYGQSKWRCKGFS